MAYLFAFLLMSFEEQFFFNFEKIPISLYLIEWLLLFIFF